MNIVVLSTISRKAGGLFYSVRWLTKELAEQGCRPMIFSPADEYSDEDLKEWTPLRVELFPCRGPLNSSPAMKRSLCRSAADLVHVHGIWQDQQWAGLKWQRRTGRPLVVSPRGMLDPWALRNAAWKKWLAGKLFAVKALKEASVIHSLCRSETDSIRRFGLRNPVAQIPNAVSLPAPGKAKDPLVEDGRKTLLFLGRIHPKKGIAELLLAWKRFSGDWKLLIAGWDDGGHDQGLKTMAAENDLSNVEFVGPKYGGEKDRLLRSVDAFILPSFSEGLPMSVLEACSYNLPVVITDYCNIPEAFDAEAAVHIEPNAESIFQGLEQLGSMSDEELEAMGSNGRHMVEEKFTWPKVAAEMRKVYEWCLTGGEPPACMDLTDG